jgi:hypothetical protein
MLILRCVLAIHESFLMYIACFPSKLNAEDIEVHVVNALQEPNCIPHPTKYFTDFLVRSSKMVIFTQLAASK